MIGAANGTRRPLRIALAGTALAAALAVPALAGPARTVLVSKTSAGQPATGGGSESASISASGRYVAFRSLATNLPGDDTVADVYIHDRETSRTKLASKTAAGQPATGGSSTDPTISGSGRQVAFTSSATNLPGDPALSDVLVHDATTGKTTLVSKTSSGEPADGDSDSSGISASARFVAFRSSATNLPGDDSVVDVYLRDRETGRTRLVSKTSSGELTNADSFRPAISGSGRYVAFSSDATNLPGNDGFTEVYVHDRKTGNTRLVSKTSAGGLLDDDASNASLSASGRYVAFQSSADNLPGAESTTDIYVHDRETGKTRLVSKNSAGIPVDDSSALPSISGSGRWVAFQAQGTTNLPGDDGTFADVYVHDRKTGKTRLVSKTSAGQPTTDGNSDEASISAKGLFVAFDSGADNLPGDDTVANVYVHGPLR